MARPRTGTHASEMSKAGVSIDRLLYILKAEQEQSPNEPAAANPVGRHLL